MWRHGGRGDASCFMTRSRQGLCSQFLLINFFFIYFAQEGGTLLVYLIYFFLQKINQNSGSVALPFGLVITQTGTHCAVQVLPPTAKQHTTSPHCARMISSSQKKGKKSDSCTHFRCDVRRGINRCRTIAAIALGSTVGKGLGVRATHMRESALDLTCEKESGLVTLFCGSFAVMAKELPPSPSFGDNALLSPSSVRTSSKSVFA